VSGCAGWLGTLNSKLKDESDRTACTYLREEVASNESRCWWLTRLRCLWTLASSGLGVSSRNNLLVVVCHAVCQTHVWRPTRDQTLCLPNKSLGKSPASQHIGVLLSSSLRLHSCTLAPTAKRTTRCVPGRNTLATSRRSFGHPRDAQSHDGVSKPTISAAMCYIGPFSHSRRPDRSALTPLSKLANQGRPFRCQLPRQQGLAIDSLNSMEPFKIHSQPRAYVWVYLHKLAESCIVRAPHLLTRIALCSALVGGDNKTEGQIVCYSYNVQVSTDGL
jgi:hypothetical protein